MFTNETSFAIRSSSFLASCAFHASHNASSTLTRASVLASGVALAAAVVLEAVFELASLVILLRLNLLGLFGRSCGCGLWRILRIDDQILAVEDRLPFVAAADPDAGRTDRARHLHRLAVGAVARAVPSGLIAEGIRVRVDHRHRRLGQVH